MPVHEYIEKLPGSEQFLAQDSEVIDRWIFSAGELLADHIPKRKITDRIIAIQVLYMFNDQAQDFAILKSQGVDTFSTEGMSVKFVDSPSGVSPTVLAIIERSGKAGTGRLI